MYSIYIDNTIIQFCKIVTDFQTGSIILYGNQQLKVTLLIIVVFLPGLSQKVSDYDQEIPQSHNADQPTAPWGRATEHL